MTDVIGAAAGVFAAGTTIGRHSGLLVVGSLGALAFAASVVARRWLPISEVVAFLIVGLALGPRGFGVITNGQLDALRPTIAVALGAMVYLIGQRLQLSVLRPIRHTLWPMALFGNVATFGVTFAALLLAGVDTPIAYLLAAIAPSTAPVTVRALVVERGAAGPFTDHLMAATALNNVTSALLFGLGAPFAFATLGSGTGMAQAAGALAQLLGAALGTGVVAGFAVRLGARVVDTTGQRFLLVWVTLILAVGAARYLGTSVVITTLVMGAVTANARIPTGVLFDPVRTLEAPIFLVFFLVTGADVHVRQFLELGVIGSVYVAARSFGRITGAWAGMSMTHQGRHTKWRWRTGVAQLPYAGMAVGLASFTVEKAAAVGATDVGEQVAAVILGAVVIFELITPLLLDRVLTRVGEAGRVPHDDDEPDEPELPKRPARLAG